MGSFERLQTASSSAVTESRRRVKDAVQILADVVTAFCIAYRWVLSPVVVVARTKSTLAYYDRLFSKYLLDFDTSVTAEYGNLWMLGDK